MGIYDRGYARADGGVERGGSFFDPPRMWSFNTWLIVSNVAVFLVMALAPKAGQFIYTWGHFSTLQGFLRLEVWRFVSFQFLHAGWLHLFFNMFGLWLFGAMVERRLGFKRYAAFYLLCGICGALLYLTLNLAGRGLGVALPGLLFTNTATPLVGASAGVFGVLMAAAYYEPNALMQIMFLPMAVKLRTLVYFYVAFALLNLLMQGKNAGGDAAHIGGAAAGYFFVRRPHLLHDFFDVLGPKKGAGKGARAATKGRGGGGKARGGGPDPGEVDRILAKVATQGLQSLTPSEKKTLQRATESTKR
ncbi:MAG: rhomboid family intramembrane serine protease [Phycisphaerales bacterium]